MQLDNAIQESLKNLGINALNEMQQSMLKEYDEKDELILLSPTGSGKTLAFLLPLINQLNPKIQNN